MQSLIEARAHAHTELEAVATELMAVKLNHA